MNAKSISTILLSIGSLLIIYGAIVLLSNQDTKFDKSKSKDTIFGRDDMGNMLGVEAENYVRKQKRSQATPFLVIGVILVVAGFIAKSMKQTPSVNNNANTNLEQLERLGKMRQQNLITEEEFESQKKKLLQINDN